MKHFSDRTWDPDSGAAEVSEQGLPLAELQADPEVAFEALPEVAAEIVADPEESLYKTRRLQDLTLVVGDDGGSEEVRAVSLNLPLGEEEPGAGVPLAETPGSPPATAAAVDDEESEAREAGEANGQNPETARSESEERRFRLASWWRRIRPSEMSRPLQINELALAAEEHLRAAAVPTLENLYLPSRLMFRLSVADWGNLMPFDEYIEEEIGTVYGRLLREPGFAGLVERPEIKVLKGANLGEGDPPQVTSRFHQHLERARWRPGQRRVAVEPAPVAESEVVDPKALPEDLLEPAAAASLGLLEALATPGADQGTARQSVRVFCFEETLPLALVDARAKAQDRLHLDEQGRPMTADGTLWNGAPWELLPPIAELPELEAPASTEMAEPPLLLIKAPGRSPICWAPGGLVAIGRDPLRSNWVPSGAPTNLSGRHLALAWVAEERALYALDLGSTNGVYQAGSRLLPLRPVRLELPSCLSIGTEGSLNLELYPVLAPGTKEPRPVPRPARPQTQDELDNLPLR